MLAPTALKAPDLQDNLLKPKKQKARTTTVRRHLHSFLVMVLWLGTAGCNRTSVKPPPRADSATTFKLLEYQAGRMPRTLVVPAGTPVFEELVAYFNAPEIASGDSTLISHVTSLLIESDLTQINIMAKQVVVSTRNSAGAVWHPVTRPKSSEDARVEAIVRELFETAPPMDG